MKYIPKFWLGSNTLNAAQIISKNENQKNLKLIQIKIYINIIVLALVDWSFHFLDNYPLGRLISIKTQIKR